MSATSIEDLAADHFSAEEWRAIAILNYRASTVYRARLAECTDKMAAARDELRSYLAAVTPPK